MTPEAFAAQASGCSPRGIGPVFIVIFVVLSSLRTKTVNTKTAPTTASIAMMTGLETYSSLSLWEGAGPKA